MNQEDKLHYILQDTFGFDSFKNNQLEPILELTKDTVQDVLCIFPTSAGKSLIYMLPTIYKQKITIIISPLLSLMQDQISKLRQLKLGAYSYSSDDTNNSKSELFQIVHDAPQQLNYIFTTPESLVQDAFVSLVNRIKNRVGLIAIDECHLITEWGKSFRRSYRNLGVIRDLVPDVSIVALTASATYHSAKEILAQLKMTQPKVFVQSFNRKNIHYSVWHKLGQMKKETTLIQIIKQYQELQPDQSIIVYTFTRMEAENLETILSQNGISSFFFHAGLSNEAKSILLRQWTTDQNKIIIATIAFAMGIDKHSVGLVVHYCLPKSLESFYQESGRAGRGGQQAYSIVLVDSSDVNTRTSNIVREDVYDQYSYYCLLKMLYEPSCRRKQILRYFKSGLKTDKQQTCCDLCDKQTIFSSIFGVQSSDFESLCTGIDNQIDHLKGKIERDDLTKITDQLNGTECVKAPSQTTQNLNEAQNILKDELIIGQQKIVQICLKKMGSYPLPDTEQNVQKIVEFMGKKAKNAEQVSAAVGSLCKYIERQTGAFNFGKLQSEAVKWFLGK
ncbi:Sgs1_DNA helicase [Hexamita inflata]|uniref:DNA 3'-5' helicase n=1 Tax=Hexamita inflata TaxID=28002 RepID=A0AA86RI59_9EUKA|nr:Sgs1 DNA helicase [Hexamita inflata]